MSPIFVRPVREQLEHDRLIRQLEDKYQRKYEVGVNVGDELTSPMKIGANTFFPDLVLWSDKKVAGVIEVETGESVNNLEAMAQWVHFGRSRAPFSLYVPVQAYDTARRLCQALGVRVNEIWTYRSLLDSFDMVRMYHDSSSARATGSSRSSKKPAGKTKAKAAAKSPKKTAKKSAKKTAKKPAGKTAKKAKAAKTTRKTATKTKKTAAKPAGKAKKARTAKSTRKTATKKASRPTRSAKGKKR